MILCCGEALIDMIPEPTVSGHAGFVPHTGGAVFNTAIALGRLGASAGLLTGLSTDMFGQQLSSALAASQVDTTLVITSDRPTTLAFVTLTDGQARYSFFDENSAGRMLTPDDMPAVPEDVTALFFGGISLACAPGAGAYAALMAREGGSRAVMLDPNIRTGFIDDAESYRARLDAMIGLADIVKVSDEDLNWIVDTPAAMAGKARVLLDKGPALVIVTCGSAGAYGFLRDGSDIHVAAETVAVVDTVGAGDTFNAGVLASLADQGLLNKDSLNMLSAGDATTALRFGAGVAAVTVSRAGAQPPWAHEL